MFNIIFPIIIFVSLAVIVFIIGKHLPEFVDIKKDDSSEKEKSKNDYWKKVFILLKNALLWLIEKLVAKFSQILGLIQSWISDLKKNKQTNKPVVKEDFTDSEKNISNTSLKENFFEKSFQNNENIDQETISETDNDSKKKEKGFFLNFKDNLKNKILEKKRKKINQVFQEIEEEDFDSSQFSDGIIGIHEKNNLPEEKDNSKLISEVKEVRKTNKNRMSLDDEIGVDRNILEKKLIGKIAQNPKDKEIYRQLGELYLKMENYTDSENCYKQILRLSVRDVDARRKVERIKLLKRSKKES
jgi:tetratricopeptide (TPR) repeat protein